MLQDDRCADREMPLGGPRDEEGRKSWTTACRVLGLQGGGALGAYQAGVYEGLNRCGLEPDWVTGISIGAINAALIAGNPPEKRVSALRAFWEQASSAIIPAPPAPGDGARLMFNELSAWWIAAFGAPGFFQPRFPGPWLSPPGTVEAISVYDTAPLHASLTKLVDFDLINSKRIRLSVGAVNVLTGNSVVFDNTERKIGPEHIMASGALPPGLPPVMVDGEPYWDGGLVSNTPLQFVLDSEKDDDLLIFQVDLFPARGPMPRTLLEVDEREKDIRYSSRTRLNTDDMLRIHKTKTALRTLIENLPPEMAGRKDVALLREAAKENAVAIVQLIYRKRAYEGGSKDYEFSRQTMLDHWASGLADVERCMREEGALFHTPRRRGRVVVLDPGKEG